MYTTHATKTILNFQLQTSNTIHIVENMYFHVTCMLIIRMPLQRLIMNLEMLQKWLDIHKDSIVHQIDLLVSVGI